MSTDAKKGVRIGTKILLVGIPIAMAAVLISALMAGISSQKALEKTAFERLTAVRELKAQQIENYFELVVDQVQSLAANRETRETMASFSYGIFLLDGLVKDNDQIDKTMVDAYYENVIAREMENTGALDADRELIKGLVPSESLALHLQMEYIVQSEAFNNSDTRALSEAGKYYKNKMEQTDLFFSDFASRFGYNDIYLVTQEDNRVAYSVSRGIEFGTSLIDGPHSDTNLARAVGTAKTLEPGEFVLADFEKYLPAFGAPTAFVASPIFIDGVRKGVLVLQISVDEINAVMTSNESWADVGLGESGETYLVGDDLLLRNQSRFLIEDRVQYLELIESIGTDAEIVRQIGNLNNSIGLQSVDTIGTRAALSGETNTTIFPDYRGVEVLSAYRPLNLPGLNWAIMSEIDKSEAFADFENLRDSLIILASVILAGAVYASYFLATAFTRPIRELEAVAGRLTSGELDEEVDTSSADEIGDLARSIEKMRIALKTSFEDVEKQKLALETEVHSRTEELELASGQLNLAMSSMPNGLHMFDKDFNFVMYNQVYLDQMKLPERYVKEGTHVLEALRFQAARGDFGVGDAEEMAQDVYRQISNRTDKYAELETPDGRVYDFRYSEETEFGGLVVVSSDITELKKKEADLKVQNDELQQIQIEMAQSEKRIAKIIQSSPDAIITIDQRGIIQSFSASAERIFGYYGDEVIGRNIKLIMPKEVAIEHDYYLERYTVGQPSTIVGNKRVLNAVRKDGSSFPIELQVELVEMDEGETIYIGTIQDITIRLQMEAEVNKAREEAETANTAKSAFLANMSHELRTPMNAIIGYSEMLAEDAEDDGLDEMIEDLGKITSAGKHLLSLINDILDLSKVEAGKMELYLETFDFKAVAEDVANTAKTLVEKNNNEFVVEIGDGLEEVTNDLTKTRQMLLNIISNAAKFTSDGTITLLGEKFQKGNVAWLKMIVRDTGIGIPADKVDTIFQEFSQADDSTTRDFGGTGLGLSLTRRFAEMMGGRIYVESVVGKGSDFIIEIPLTVVKKHEGLEAEASFDEAGAAQVTPAKVLKELNKENPLILVIDDEANARDLLQRALEQDGCQVRTANNGSEGLKVAAELKPDLITLDVMMPGMDGWAVLRKLKEDKELKDIPVLMVSMIGDRAMSYELGAVDTMQKPFDRAKLRSLIKQYVRGGTKTALIVEDDDAARATLRKFLEGDKWNVTEAVNGAIGLEKATATAFDLILLDLMMPVMDGFEFLHLLRGGEYPSTATPVVVVTAKDLDHDDRAKLQGSVEDIVSKTGRSVDEILTDVRHALHPNNSSDGEQ